MLLRKPEEVLEDLGSDEDRVAICPVVPVLVPPATVLPVDPEDPRVA